MTSRTNIPKISWKDLVRNALIELGGQGHLSEINEIVKNHPKARSNPNWEAQIRKVIRIYKIFEPALQEKRGTYRVVQKLQLIPLPEKIAYEPAIPSEESIIINHGIVQGMIITLGNLYGYETYADKQDQTKRSFQGKVLSEYVTISDISEVFNSKNLDEIGRIDTLWFDEDDDGLFPVYAFEVEHTTKVKWGLDRLLKIPKRFNTKFFILGPSVKEKDEFEKLTNQTPVKDYRERFLFRYYSELEELFNCAIIHDEKQKQFSIIQRGK